MMNRKVMAKIIESEKGCGFNGGGVGTNESSSLPNLQVRLLEADDGVSAVEMLRSEIAAGRTVDMVLMDFVMVCAPMNRTVSSSCSVQND